ncbi:MAG: oligosaccharide flippase family protein [Anaerolineae bacterium]|nr:oligosaccharide flippase family protein [Anaerolineae bacterium]
MKCILGWWNRIWQGWRQDRLLQAVMRNTGYLFSGNTLSMVITSLMGLLTAVMLGAAGYGELGMIVMYASSVNRLFSFRMGEVVIKYAGQHLALGERRQASAVIKTAAAVEAVTSLFAYLLLVITAPAAALYIIKDPQAAPLLVFYGISLLGGLIAETCTATLQLGGHYRTQAALTLVQSLLTAVLIAVAFVLHGGLVAVLFAYLAGKLVLGLGSAIMALHWMRSLLGEGWHQTPFHLIANRREMARFAISTNLSGTINLVIRDSEVLWVGFFLSKVEAGYYKFALALMNVILMPITPFITTTFPEITRSVAQKSWRRLRDLIQRTSMVAAAWTLACGVGILLLGNWVLTLLKNGEYLPSYPAILILLLGFGTANIFFWNRPLLLAFGRPNYPLVVTALVGACKTLLMFILVRPYGFLAQAALLSSYFIVSVSLIVRKGWVLMKGEEASSLRENEMGVLTNGD